ncbi:MAG: molecular chaperone TorD family protein [Nitrospina sp.]|jgi:putative dimethyl sulfoxide reductase chaperone|nr:molecular chaperone TorD family protein [Nitrospina sp.]MBT3877035.1 molecular chaperone TorD family protein [Nitrospina sp.]MBT4048306.1 molecular chaperone TorD family protein [Nitrospina sp.]MBT4558249.1 molecular chaperone TorD family protein [Nitrospina sp.]MBT5348518.1 molecular chaperone TorD family protein [Nitrospina sp.]
MGDVTKSKVSGDPMLAVLGQTGSLEELKEERISLQLARGRVYDILSSAFSYPWNRKFFRPKSLLEPLDIALVDEEDWNHVKSIIETINKYLPKMTVKQAQQEYIRVFGHAVSMECPPYEMQYGTEGGIQSQTDVLIQLGGFYDTFGFEQPRNRTRERVDHISIELAFMFFMCFRTAFGIENGHEERNINVLGSSMKKFLRNHIGRWGPLFCIFTARKAERGLYKEIVDILAIFLRNENLLLDINPVKVEEPEYRSLSYSMENDLVANAPSECEPR